jgi:K+/H+ antiporter YhaU regulatory subunit KhtT
MSVLDASRHLKENNGATLLAIARDDKILTNPGPNVILLVADEIVVMAESLERLASLSEPKEEAVEGAVGR